LRRLLEDFLWEEGFDMEGSRFYSHVLPALSDRSLRHLQVQGDGWSMIGDAAGFVDPITGEGLYYALRSAELLGEALITDRPEQYQEQVAADFLLDLQLAAGIAARFFLGNVLGASVIERMVEFTESSSSFRVLMCDLFAGSQGYVGLKHRAYCNLLPSVVEVFLHHVFGDEDPALHPPAHGTA
jgi:flavin-dependent dehydrogenase